MLPLGHCPNTQGNIDVIIYWKQTVYRILNEWFLVNNLQNTIESKIPEEIHVNG
jgi:hypothetical protein